LGLGFGVRVRVRVRVGVRVRVRARVRVRVRARVRVRVRDDVLGRRPPFFCPLGRSLGILEKNVDELYRRSLIGFFIMAHPCLPLGLFCLECERSEPKTTCGDPIEIQASNYWEEIRFYEEEKDRALL
jgi:hypothetical protein